MTTYTTEETDGHVEIRNADGCTVWCGRREDPYTFRACVGRGLPRPAEVDALRHGAHDVLILPPMRREVTITVRMTVDVEGPGAGVETSDLWDALERDGVQLHESAALSVEQITEVAPTHWHP